jgi:hypothetical protein
MAVHPIFGEIIQTMSRYTCPLCGVLNNHLADCPSQLATPEQRIRRAADLFDSFTAWKAEEICRENNIPEDEIATGRQLRQYRFHERLALDSIHGSVTFGARRVPQAELDDIRDGEQLIIDAHLSKLRKPNTFQQLTLEEQLVASIAVVNYRKGVA